MGAPDINTKPQKFRNPMKKRQFTRWSRRRLFTSTDSLIQSVSSEYFLAGNGFYKSRLYLSGTLASTSASKNIAIFYHARLSCLSQPVLGDRRMIRGYHSYRTWIPILGM